MKYEILREEGDFLRIRSVRDIKTSRWPIPLPAGTVGGLIANENCLSQQGNCWVDENSIVHPWGQVWDDAVARDSSIHGMLRGEAKASSSVVSGTMNGYAYAARSLVTGRMTHGTRADMSIVGGVLYGDASMEHSILGPGCLLRSGLLEQMQVLDNRLLLQVNTASFGTLSVAHRVRNRRLVGSPWWEEGESPLAITVGCQWRDSFLELRELAEQEEIDDLEIRLIDFVEEMAKCIFDGLEVTEPSFSSPSLYEEWLTRAGLKGFDA